jgi:beta-lactam-binding protein with PASTA domain
MAFKININAVEKFVSGHARFVVAMVFGAAALMALTALVVFFIALRGAEQTLVPDLRGMDLVEALQELQVKELYPRIQTRYSEYTDDRGAVLEQDPPAGTIVKAGRRIRLVVSQGMMVNVIEDYRGRDIEEVRMDLRALLAPVSRSLLTIKEPFMYEYSSAKAGVILEQKPKPGEPVSGPVTLEFVVSRGPEYTTVIAPGLTGLGPAEAVALLEKTGLGFSFSLREARPGEGYGMVVFQDPAEGAAVGSGLPVNLLVTAPAGGFAAGEVFALFSYSMSENPYPLPVRLEALRPGANDREILVEVSFGGGLFSFPYRAAPDTVLILSAWGRELYREIVTPPMDELSLDEI